ncbi:MAG: hypothetical protein JEZ01_18330 [Labilibaculum sp.]|nr:hypothetical protein [Labilibaculum sp.]MBI9059728.1 hypothetical protein [Labilibaculum sp.]
MKSVYKIIVGIICLILAVLYQLYFTGVIVIVDQEITDFLSGVLVGAGASILVISIFKSRKNKI